MKRSLHDSLLPANAMPLTIPSVFPPGSDPLMKFPSRRSVVHSTKGIVACTQPLAAKCGIEILDAGGNCADAAIAVGTSKRRERQKRTRTVLHQLHEI